MLSKIMNSTLMTRIVYTIYTLHVGDKSISRFVYTTSQCTKSISRCLLRKYYNKQIVYCQSRRPQRSCIISTNLDTMIRLIYMISILIIYMYTSYIYIYMGNRLLVYEYNNHKDDRLIIQEAAHHMS